MKKNLLILAFAAPLIAFGQKPAFLMGDGVTVKVKKNTLVYTSGDFKVLEGVGTASNDGHVKVDGGFTGTDNGERFVNEFTSGEDYGQLIITGDASKKMTGKYGFSNKSAFPYHPVAVPYSNYSVQNLVDDVGMSNNDGSSITVFPKGGTRYKSPVFTDNLPKFQSDNPALSSTLSPVKYHNLNQQTSSIASKSSLIGKPAAGNHTVTLTGYSAQGKKNNDLNEYGEYIGSFIIDPLEGKPSSSWGDFRNTPVVINNNFGSNLFAFGNPYTSNLNLKELFKSNLSAIRGVFVTESSTYTGNDGNTPNTGSGKLAYANGVGDDLFTIKPYQTFTVKATLSVGATANIEFNDDVKTFESELGTTQSFSNARSNANNFEEFYQVGFDLYDGARNTENRVYVVASDFYKDQGNSEYEGYNIWIGDGVGFYSLQEKADGTIAEDLSDQKVYINGINATDYVAKPVHLVFQGKDNTPYTLKVRLNDALVNSKNKFYFEDKKEGRIMEVTSDFEYTFVEPTVNKDRFVVYWNGVPETMATQDITSSKTQVYKDGVEHKVRFAVEFNRADVYIYDLNGRLISVEKSVDTSVDHVLPYLSKGSVFVVKVVGDNGDVTTQKIIK